MPACRWPSSRKIQRQKGDYAGAVAAIRDGDLKKAMPSCESSAGSSRARAMTRLVAEYATAIEETKAERREENRAGHRSHA